MLILAVIIGHAICNTCFLMFTHKKILIVIKSMQLITPKPRALSNRLNLDPFINNLKQSNNFIMGEA